jgi:hypothetical protein
MVDLYLSSPQHSRVLGVLVLWSKTLKAGTMEWFLIGLNVGVAIGLYAGFRFKSWDKLTEWLERQNVI